MSEFDHVQKRIVRSANGAVSAMVSSKFFHFINGDLAFLIVLANEKKSAVILLDLVLGIDVFLFSLINLLEKHPEPSTCSQQSKKSTYFLKETVHFKVRLKFIKSP